MDWLRKVKELFLRFLRDHPELGGIPKTMRVTTRPTVWELLVLEKNFELIEKLKKVEDKEAGYGTIVVPRGGFSSNPETHLAVLAWLKSRRVNVLDVSREIEDLYFALHENDSKEAYNAIT
jgi:hypothetical protein